MTPAYDQANGFRNTVTHKQILTVDELRRAAEDLGDDYYRLDYFERTTRTGMGL